MRRSHAKTVLCGAKVLVPAVFIMVFLTAAMRVAGQCGCMDVALVVDDTGSMGPAIANVKAELPAIIATAQAASGGDLRMGLVSFPNDNVVVRQAFTTNISLVQTAIQALVAGTGTGGANEPESSDEALQFVVTGAADPSCTVSNAPFGAFRSQCVKIAVLITDARPGGCDDTFTAGVDDVHAHTVANAAASAGVLVSAIYVPTFGENPVIQGIMQDYADTSGGVFVQTSSDGTGTGEGIADIIASCGSTGSNQDITRTARYWFTHAYSTDPNCATLLKAIQLNGGRLNLGFVGLATANRTADNVTDANDALVEALSFYWRSNGKTGEDSGTQNQKLKGSSLCKERKRLAVELIPAIANVRLLGTKPSSVTYFNGLVVTNFPANLIQQARTAVSGGDLDAIRSMTVLLQKFNNSGVTNDFQSGLVECSAQKKKDLRALSRDPTTQATCPGVNDVCVAAQELVAFPYDQSLALNKYHDDLPSPSCATGGREAIWRISPPVAATGRQFLVQTDGSNFDTVISVSQGACGALSEVGCVDNVLGVRGEQLTFTTDGTNTFFIVIEGKNGAYGKLKMSVSSF